MSGGFERHAIVQPHFISADDQERRMKTMLPNPNAANSAATEFQNQRPTMRSRWSGTFI
jgi:hypothetical protein